MWLQSKRARYINEIFSVQSTVLSSFSHLPIYSSLFHSLECLLSLNSVESRFTFHKSTLLQSPFSL